jgi:hypothetical protein
MSGGPGGVSWGGDVSRASLPGPYFVDKVRLYELEDNKRD